MDPINLIELEAIAREKLSREAYDYYASGAQDDLRQCPGSPLADRLDFLSTTNYLLRQRISEA